LQAATLDHGIADSRVDTVEEFALPIITTPD
jgi:hypothetical protein